MTVVKPEGIVSFSGSIFWGVCAGSAESVVAGGAAAGATGPDFGGPGGVLVVGALARARIVLVVESESVTFATVNVSIHLFRVGKVEIL